MEKIKPYIKSILAVVGAVAVVVQTALSDDNISSAEWGTILTAFLTAVAVYLFPNRPEQEPKV